ncbi:farnesol dehydrogenase-like [Trichogramma pretiosum]|uniref:farnesol dehydrogenase-like n=1 Tax=Trichogramma pretiosum TaxID=7493 RepID=UPI0006C9B31A|nr:farnesol dehydrogenase-like [Trichogramma pretiosum]
MERWNGKVAVITGASAGIGLATAKALVNHGLIVVGLARRKSKMEEEMSKVKGPGKFFAKECDITREQDIAAAFAWIKDNLGTVNILINNSGVLREKTMEEASMEELQFVINVNVVGLISCTKHAIKLMKANGQEGHIVNINSIAGQQVPKIEGKSYNVYSATKFAVRSISETLTHELLGNKIRVCNISPGVVKTEIFQEAGVDPFFLNLVPALEPEDIAQSILHVISAPIRVQITELTIKPLGEIF